jgi:hypothetical protein
VRFYRIGSKVVSRDKLVDAIDDILEDREAGATQEDAARDHGVQRSFISFLETLGEIRRGGRVAVVGFPVANRDEVSALADEYGVDFVLVVSQDERESIEAGPAGDVFNRLLETLAALREFDVVVLLASDWRIKTIERILGTEIVGIPLGHTPLREDVTVDIEAFGNTLASVMARPEIGAPTRRRGRTRRAIRAATEIAGRWTPSKRS